MYQIVMLAGKLCSGKDTLGKYLIEKHGFVRIALADSIKEYVSLKYKIDLATCHSQEGKKQLVLVDNKQVPVRQLLINEGREKGSKFWSDIVINKIKNQSNKKVVITDFRFPEEYHNIAKVFFDPPPTTIEITRKSLIVNEFSKDLSETALSSFLFNHTIKNDYTIEDLYKSYDKIKK